GDVVGAEVELRRALELKQSENTVVPLLATALLAQGKGKDVQAMFSKTTLTDAKSDLALKIRLAEAEAMVNNIDGALAILAEVLKASPEPAQARILNARLTAYKGNVADAMAQLDALITRDPTQAEAFLVKGDLLQRGPDAKTPPDLPAAAASYRQALKLRSGYLQAHFALTSLLVTQDDMSGIKAELAELQKVAPKHPQTMFFDAIVSEREGDLKKARELTQQLLRGASNNV
ncbi:MAG: hypothetical protein CFE44_27435, partial [Burkholderiales bacterium PBB4]